MKNINDYIKESLLDDEDEVLDHMGNDIAYNKIRAWLDDPGNCEMEGIYKRKNLYLDKLTVTKNHEVDYEGSITIYKDLPDYIKFNKVTGEMSFVGKYITTLKGSPKEVDGWFRCDHLPNLKSLEGGPKKVAAMFDCSACPKLKSLKGCPEYVGGNFICAKPSNETQYTMKDVEKYCKHVGAKIWGIK